MIIEHHVFTLADGVAETAFLTADSAVQTEFAPFQEGFIRRTTARNDTHWLVETLWYSTENADAAAGVDHPALVALKSCIDSAGEQIDRFQTLD